MLPCDAGIRLSHDRRRLQHREAAACRVEGDRGRAEAVDRTANSTGLNLTQMLDAPAERCLLRKAKPSPSGGFDRADARTRTGDPFITRNRAGGVQRLGAASEAGFQFSPLACFPLRAESCLTQNLTHETTP